MNVISIRFYKELGVERQSSHRHLFTTGKVASNREGLKGRVTPGHQGCTICHRSSVGRQPVASLLLRERAWWRVYKLLFSLHRLYIRTWHNINVSYCTRLHISSDYIFVHRRRRRGCLSCLISYTYSIYFYR